MINLLYYSYLIPIAFAFLSSLKTFRLDWPVSFKMFSIFLLATLSIEIFAILWKYTLHQGSWWDYSINNLWIYNIYLVPQYLFYIYFFSNQTPAGWLKKYGSVLSIGYGLFALWNLLFYQGLFAVNYLTITVANFIVIFFAVTYFVRLMKAPTVVRLSGQPLVWIAIGAFIFHLGSLPCFMLYNFIFSWSMTLASSLFRIIIILNFIMYLLYSIGFLCTRTYPMSPS